MLPNFDADGKLPPGIHVASWSEVQERCGFTPHRRQLLSGLLDALTLLRIAGCKRAYLDGSFATNEPAPADYDVCYEARGVDPMYLDNVFFDMRAGRAAQKAKYGGEFFPTSMPAAPGFTFLQFFQIDKRTGDQKGIVAINLETI